MTVMAGLELGGARNRGCSVNRNQRTRDLGTRASLELEIRTRNLRTRDQFGTRIWWLGALEADLKLQTIGLGPRAGLKNENHL